MAPKLINISSDPSLSGAMVFFITSAVVTVGAHGSGSMISLSSEGDILAKHAIIRGIMVKESRSQKALDQRLYVWKLLFNDCDKNRDGHLNKIEFDDWSQQVLQRDDFVGFSDEEFSKLCKQNKLPIKLGVSWEIVRNTFVNDGSGGNLSNDSNMDMNIAEIVGIPHKKINEQLISDLKSMIFDEHNVLTLSMTEYGTISVDFQYDKSDSDIQAFQQEIRDLFESTKYGKKVKFLRPNDPQLSKLKSGGGSNGDQIEKLKITIESANPTNNNIIFVSKERVRAIFQFINQASINRYYWTQEAPLTALLCQNKSRPTTHGITSILSPILTVSSTKINTQSLAFTTYTNNGKTSDNIIVIDGYIDSPKTAAWNIMQASFSFFIRFCFWIYELKYYWFQLIIVINAIIMMTRWNLFRTSEITLLVFISLLSVSGSGSVTVTCTQRISTGVTSGSNFLKQACNVGELLVSCGIKPTVAGVNGYIRGTLVISEECWVKTHTYGAGQARAVAQCCTFSDTLPSCSLDNGGIVIGDNSVSTVQCGTGATFLHPLMFSCGGQSASAAVDGMYPNTIQPDTLEFWKYDCNHDLTNPQTCTFRTGNGPSYDQGGAIASCCASTYPINCVVRYGQPGFPFSNVSCPDGYFITTCNAWSNTVNIAGYFIEGNVCNAQSRGDSNQNIYSSAICCTTGVIDSDDFCKPPTTDPSISPTQAPSIAPSIVPTQPPSIAPTQPPSISPTQPPSIAPSISPTQLPSIAPSFTPSFTTDPTNNPTPNPTDNPTPNPTVSPWPKEAVSDDEESNSGSRSNSGSFDDAYVLGALLSERQHDNNGANKDEESNSGSFDDAYVSGALISERKHGNNGANKNEESNSGSRSNSGSFDDAYVSGALMGALLSERQHDNNGANKDEESNSGSFDDAYVSGALISERKHGNNGANKNEESNSGSRSNSGSFD
eukprot:395694_1